MKKLIIIAVSSIVAAAPAPALGAKHHACHKHQHHHCLHHKKPAASAPTAKTRVSSPALVPAAGPALTEPLPPGTVEIGPDELEWVEATVPRSLQEEEAMIREIEQEEREAREQGTFAEYTD